MANASYSAGVWLSPAEIVWLHEKHCLRIGPISSDRGGGVCDLTNGRSFLGLQSISQTLSLSLAGSFIPIGAPTVQSFFGQSARPDAEFRQSGVAKLVSSPMFSYVRLRIDGTLVGLGPTHHPYIGERAMFNKNSQRETENLADPTKPSGI